MDKIIKPTTTAMLLIASGTIVAIVLWRLHGDVTVGRRLVENHCGVCHDITPDKKNERGPYLWGIVDRPVGAALGYKYSQAYTTYTREHPFLWTEDNLDRFLTNPQEFIPNVRMSEHRVEHQIAFDGIEDQANRRDLIAYLKRLR
ncbi:MAG: c-type cytochrome [Magnetococcales bacterium]|nr:c-type cytochrome [Magnetococcales bacterium]MBF0321844.1 c-type cytochrome [Magnetococcales bacterium]